jgi:hypothetical protein
MYVEKKIIMALWKKSIENVDDKNPNKDSLSTVTSALNG